MITSFGRRFKLEDFDERWLTVAYCDLPHFAALHCCFAAANADRKSVV